MNADKLKAIARRTFKDLDVGGCYADIAPRATMAHIDILLDDTVDIPEDVRAFYVATVLQYHNALDEFGDRAERLAHLVTGEDDASWILRMGKLEHCPTAVFPILAEKIRNQGFLANILLSTNREWLSTPLLENIASRLEVGYYARAVLADKNCGGLPPSVIAIVLERVDGSTAAKHVMRENAANLPHDVIVALAGMIDQRRDILYVLKPHVRMYLPDAVAVSLEAKLVARS